jgi:hypothetical protein
MIASSSWVRVRHGAQSLELCGRRVIERLVQAVVVEPGDPLEMRSAISSVLKVSTKLSARALS